mgnify:CR=1 FL=1
MTILRKSRLALCAIPAMLALSACQTSDPTTRGLARGAAIGAAGGAALGAVVGGVGVGEGAAIGAAAGAAIGAATAKDRRYYRDGRGDCYYRDGDRRYYVDRSRC